MVGSKCSWSPISAHPVPTNTYTHSVPNGSSSGHQRAKGPEAQRSQGAPGQGAVWANAVSPNVAPGVQRQEAGSGPPPVADCPAQRAFCSGPTQILPWTLSLPVPLPPPGDWDPEPPSADPIPPLSSAPSSHDPGHSYLPVPQFPHLCLPLFAQGPPEPGPTSWVLRINPMAAWDRGRAPQTQRQGGWSANLILPPLPHPGSHSPAALP